MNSNSKSLDKTLPLLSPASDSAVGTMSDLTPDADEDNATGASNKLNLSNKLNELSDETKKMGVGNDTSDPHQSSLILTEERVKEKEGSVNPKTKSDEILTHQNKNFVDETNQCGPSDNLIEEISDSDEIITQSIDHKPKTSNSQLNDETINQDDPTNKLIEEVSSSILVEPESIESKDSNTHLSGDDAFTDENINQDDDNLIQEVCDNTVVEPASVGSKHFYESINQGDPMNKLSEEVHNKHQLQPESIVSNTYSNEEIALIKENINESFPMNQVIGEVGNNTVMEPEFIGSKDSKTNLDEVLTDQDEVEFIDPKGSNTHSSKDYVLAENISKDDSMNELSEKIQTNVQLQSEPIDQKSLNTHLKEEISLTDEGTRQNYPINKFIQGASGNSEEEFESSDPEDYTLLSKDVLTGENISQDEPMNELVVDFECHNAEVLNTHLGEEKVIQSAENIDIDAEEVKNRRIDEEDLDIEAGNTHNLVGSLNPSQIQESKIFETETESNPLFQEYDYDSIKRKEFDSESEEDIIEPVAAVLHINEAGIVDETMQTSELLEPQIIVNNKTIFEEVISSNENGKDRNIDSILNADLVEHLDPTTSLSSVPLSYLKDSEFLDDPLEDSISLIDSEEGSDISETDLVVSASMQFTLTPSNMSESKEEQPAIVEQQEIPRLSPNPGGVPIYMKHQKQQIPSANEESQATEEDITDYETEEHSPSPNPKTDLPSTVTRLTTEEGSEVYLVGTAHFSKESQEDVAKTIRMVRPDVVMVELCKSRTAVLQLDEETILNESKSLDFGKARVIIRQHGKVQGILYLLLLSISAHITKQLGMAPGGEFRIAFSEARRVVPDCLIQLGDRPIQVTLSRALSSLSLWQKMKLFWHIIASNEPISKEEVEKCKQRDFIEEMLEDMTGQFPAISEVFVKERDIYLTKSLQTAAQSVPDCRFPEGYTFIPRVVVGVVGIGHVPGITQHWGKVTDEDIPPIMCIPPPSFSDKLCKFTIKFTLYGLVGFGVYKCLPASTKSSLFSVIETNINHVSKYLSK